MVVLESSFGRRKSRTGQYDNGGGQMQSAEGTGLGTTGCSWNRSCWELSDGASWRTGPWMTPVEELH